MRRVAAPTTAEFSTWCKNDALARVAGTIASRESGSGFRRRGKMQELPRAEVLNLAEHIGAGLHPLAKLIYYLDTLPGEPEPFGSLVCTIARIAFYLDHQLP